MQHSTIHRTLCVFFTCHPPDLTWSFSSGHFPPGLYSTFKPHIEGARRIFALTLATYPDVESFRRVDLASSRHGRWFSYKITVHPTPRSPSPLHCSYSVNNICAFTPHRFHFPISIHIHRFRMAENDARLAASQMYESVTILPPAKRHIITHNEEGKSTVHSSPTLQYYGYPGIGGTSRSCTSYLYHSPTSESKTTLHTVDISVK